MTDRAGHDSLEAAILASARGGRMAFWPMHEPEGNAQGARRLFQRTPKPPVGSPGGEPAGPILMKGLAARSI
ncbi:MAG: hypothetical protein ACOVLI_12205 [Rhabdaerophilum sp.]|nr:hypothetical protein [Methylobacterium sp.]MCA3622855.1 hypothetical protein [Methylobacterium sp.]MCA3627172.1 hypothetical protein [Methylobacterium sp.]